MESASNTAGAYFAQRINYEDYLKSSHWALIRNEAFNRVNRRCESCSKFVPLQGHHLRYRNLTDCTSDDIMGLCEPCHADWHKHYSSHHECSRDFVLGFLSGLRKCKNPKKTISRKLGPAGGYPRITERGSKKEWDGSLEFFLRDSQFIDACKLEPKKLKIWMNRYYRGFTNKKSIKRKGLELQGSKIVSTIRKN